MVNETTRKRGRPPKVAPTIESPKADGKGEITLEKWLEFFRKQDCDKLKKINFELRKVTKVKERDPSKLRNWNEDREKQYQFALKAITVVLKEKSCCHHF